LVCAEAMTSKEAALVLDCGDEAQQVQERKNEGAKNLPAGTAVLKAPALTAGGQQGILFLNGFKSFTSPTPTNLQETFKWHCCAVSDCKFVAPLGLEGKPESHSRVNKHLNDSHSVVGQQPGTVVALQNHDALCLVVESEETQIGTPRVKFLTTPLLLITACLPFVHVESPYFRSLADVTISAQNARRYVTEICLSIVNTIYGVLKKVVDVSMGLKMFWWNADLRTCPSNGKKFLGVRVYWGNSRLERKSALLVATLYRPSVKDFKKGEKSTSILRQYIDAIPKHFGIDKQCAGSVTDVGSDVKSASAGAAFEVGFF